MKIIVALGNPGEKYKNTRHNVGWLALDFLIAEFKLQNANWEKKFHSEILEIHNSPLPPLTLRGGVIVVKPQTYMNESGKAVKEICDFYKLNYTKDLLVLQDEIDLPLGKIRHTHSSSAAGHNGIKSIIEHLGTQDFQRLRIGVESRLEKTILPTEAFVLQNFLQTELEQLQKEVFPKIELEIKKFLNL